MKFSEQIGNPPPQKAFDTATSLSKIVYNKKEESPLVEDFEQIPDEVIRKISGLPDKLAFKIGEAAELIGVKQYVLRFWESEFDQLRPRKSSANQRVYTKKDIETGILIDYLLHTERYSIEGARKALSRYKKQIRVEKDWEGLKKGYGDLNSELKELAQEIARIRLELFS